MPFSWIRTDRHCTSEFTAAAEDTGQQHPNPADSVASKYVSTSSVLVSPLKQFSYEIGNGSSDKADKQGLRNTDQKPAAGVMASVLPRHRYRNRVQRVFTADHIQEHQERPAAAAAVVVWQKRTQQQRRELTAATGIETRPTRPGRPCSIGTQRNIGGAMGSIVLRGFSTMAPSQAAIPAEMYTTVPPAKSGHPIWPIRPAGCQAI